MPANRDLLERVIRDAFPDAAIDHVGTGGFASTFRVREEGRDLAVKVLDPEKSGVIRSEREERALALLDHPHVVAYEGTGTHDFGGQTFRYLAMEYVEGQSLSDSLQAGEDWPLDRILTLAADLVAGASAIWATQLAHRDLTPDNMMLRPDGSVVIVDLGIARHLDLETVTALPTPGTPGWMAPEQVGLEPDHGDWRSDQFVLGLVLYLLTTGLIPFSADNREDLWRAPAEQELRPPQAVNPEVPAVVGDLIQQMTAREPYQRFLRPDLLAGAINAAAAQLATTTAPAGTPTRLLFGLAQGHVKNFAEDPFYADLSANAVVLDGRCMNAQKASELAASAHAAGSLRLLDPVNYYDRSPLDARKAGYQSLPYGGGPRLTGFADDAARANYAKPIVDYQLNANVDAVIGPYFYVRPGETIWLRESFELADAARDHLTQQSINASVWTAAAVSAEFFRGGRLPQLLNLLTSEAPETLYLLVHTGQAPNSPLRDIETLRGLRTLIDTMNQAGTAIVIGRRFTEGLLLCALGAAGWTTGASATHQDFEPPPDTAGAEDGGRGLDWFYTPTLLNSVSLPRRAAVQAAHPAIFTPTTAPGRSLFSGNPARAALAKDTAARVELVRHNLIAMREQAAALAGVAPNLRVASMRRWVEDARAAYSAIGGPWHAAEDPAFLNEWLKVL